MLLTDLLNYMRCFLRITFLFVIINVKAEIGVWYSVLFGTRKLIISSEIMHQQQDLALVARSCISREIMHQQQDHALVGRSCISSEIMHQQGDHALVARSCISSKIMHQQGGHVLVARSCISSEIMHQQQDHVLVVRYSRDDDRQSFNRLTGRKLFFNK